MPKLLASFATEFFSGLFLSEATPQTDEGRSHVSRSAAMNRFINWVQNSPECGAGRGTLQSMKTLYVSPHALASVATIAHRQSLVDVHGKESTLRLGLRREEAVASRQPSRSGIRQNVGLFLGRISFRCPPKVWRLPLRHASMNHCRCPWQSSEQTRTRDCYTRPKGYLSILLGHSLLALRLRCMPPVLGASAVY